MAKVEVIKSYIQNNKFYFEGILLNGDLDSVKSALISLNRSLSLDVPIASVEFNENHLIIQLEFETTEELELLEMMNIGQEIIDLK